MPFLAALGSIVAWLVRLGPWLRAFLPAAARMGWAAYTGFAALKFGKKLLIIGLVGAFFPVPDFVDAIPGMLAQLPAPAPFLLNLVQAQYGFSVIMGAYTWRWVWKTLMD